MFDFERLRSALLEAPARTVFQEDDGVGEADLLAAAVLLPIVVRPAVTNVLLTRRTDHLRAHPGQISFPGGRIEARDHSPAQAALREAQEEIGLAPQAIDVLGFLPEYRTVSTGYRITPVVGLVHPPFELRPDPGEVAEVFEVPLDYVLDPENHQRRVGEYRGRPRQFFVIEYGGRCIWGATAGILVSLSRALEG